MKSNQAIDRKSLHALIARAQSDAEIKDIEKGLDRAIRDFGDRLPYPFLWYVYRSRFKLRRRELDKGLVFRYY
jgi:hypothetical protein